MRQYLVDEISRGDIEKVNAYLHENAYPSALVGVYWIHIPNDLLDGEQYRHKECQPFCFAIEVGDGHVKFEFLIRSRSNLRCDCIKYATAMQRDFIINFSENLINTLGIRT
jgi:hypothetical protein